MPKLLIVLLGALGVALLAAFRPWKSKGIGRLMNNEGVGPAHIHGVPRGEAQSVPGGGEPTSVAGRIAGSVQPV